MDRAAPRKRFLVVSGTMNADAQGVEASAVHGDQTALQPDLPLELPDKHGG